MTTIYLIYRPSRGQQEAAGSIFMRIIHRRKSRTHTLVKGIMPKEWDSKQQSIIFPADNEQRTAFLKEIARQLTSQLAVITDIIDHLHQQGYYTVDDIMDKYRMIAENGTLLSFVDKLAKELERTNQQRTADAYRTCASGFIDFTGDRKFKLSDINSIVVKAFEANLRGRGKAPNTISYYMRNLRAIYNKAVNNKQIREKKTKPFQGVFTGFHKTTKRSMTTVELERLFSLELLNKLEQSEPAGKEHIKYTQLYKAWRLFFFCFYTQGLCFVDLSYLKKENIRDGVLTYYRRKTGQLMEVKVTDDMQYIIESFREETSGSPYLFPIITHADKDERKQYSSAMRNQNRRLEELAKLAGLDRKVTTHVARHTYATFLKRNHLPVSVISQSLGHTTEKTTATYLDSLDRTVIEQANEKVTAPFRLVPLKRTHSSTDYGGLIAELLQSPIINSDKAQIFYPLLKGILHMMEVGG